MPHRATTVALATLLLAWPFAASAAADVAGDPDDVSDDDLDNAVSGLNSAEDHIADITLEDSIEELEKEDVEGDTTTVTISADVLFDFDEATLSDNAEETLSDVTTQLSEVSGTVEVVGHSDGVGEDSYNQELSEDRADAVKEALENELGSDAPDIEADGMGSDDPVAEETGPEGGDNPSGRAQNRRVEISFEGE